MIEAAKEAQVFAARKPGIETDVTAGVIAELAANGAGSENGIVACDLRVASGGEQQRGENAEERGFAGTICTQQRHRFAGRHFEGNPGEGDDRRLFERLQKGAPAAARRRKRLLETYNVNRGFRHDETDSVSLVPRQSVSGAGSAQLNGAARVTSPIPVYKNLVSRVEVPL